MAVFVQTVSSFRPDDQSFLLQGEKNFDESIPLIPLLLPPRKPSDTVSLTLSVQALRICDTVLNQLKLLCHKLCRTIRQNERVDASSDLVEL
jgi:hypothetical protein